MKADVAPDIRKPGSRFENINCSENSRQSPFAAVVTKACTSDGDASNTVCATSVPVHRRAVPAPRKRSGPFEGLRVTATGPVVMPRLSSTVGGRHTTVRSRIGKEGAFSMPTPHAGRFRGAHLDTTSSRSSLPASPTGQLPPPPQPSTDDRYAPSAAGDGSSTVTRRSTTRRNMLTMKRSLPLARFCGCDVLPSAGWRHVADDRKRSWSISTSDGRVPYCRLSECRWSYAPDRGMPPAPHKRSSSLRR